MNLNNQITARRVKMVTESGLTEMELSVALQMAGQHDLDLVQVSDDIIPVVKMYDYQKSLYQQKKNKKETKKTIVVKEIQFRTDTQQHDLNIKLTQLKDFLAKGYQVKIVMRVTTSKRNVAALDKAGVIFANFLDSIGDYAVVQPCQQTTNYYNIWIKAV